MTASPAIPGERHSPYFLPVVVIKFRMGYVFIRFVGTHAEYDRINCATIKGA